MAIKKQPRLLVVFDTSALYTQTASSLVKDSLKSLISENSNHSDLNIQWYIPNVVVAERRYQMMDKASDLLPNLGKLEKLMGHGFGVAEDTLELHVNNAISRELKEIGFKVLDLSTDIVDWNDIIHRSVTRLPPFEAGEKEKGFRDAVIGQCFLQLHAKSAATPTVCRLALVTNDKRLRNYVEVLTTESKNIRLLDSLEELENLINTIVSTIPEEFVAELTKKANKLFFEKENQKSFYYSKNIQESIEQQYDKEMSEKQNDNQLREGGTWWLSKPIFLKKEKQQLYWSTTIEVDFTLYHFFNRPVEKSISSGPKVGSKLTSSGTVMDSSRHRSGIGSRILGGGLLSHTILTDSVAPEKIIDYQGADKFEVYWKTSLSTAKNLTAPKLEKIVYMGSEAKGDNS